MAALPHPWWRERYFIFHYRRGAAWRGSGRCSAAMDISGATGTRPIRLRIAYIIDIT